MRLLPLALAALIAATPALADSTTGTIAAYDRQANVIVMKDKTIWRLAPETLVPANLEAGDVVRIEYASNGDSGWGKILSLTKVES